MAALVGRVDGFDSQGTGSEPAAEKEKQITKQESREAEKKQTEGRGGSGGIFGAVASTVSGVADYWRGSSAKNTEQEFVNVPESDMACSSTPAELAELVTEQPHHSDQSNKGGSQTSDARSISEHTDGDWTVINEGAADGGLDLQKKLKEKDKDIRSLQRKVDQAEELDKQLKAAGIELTKRVQEKEFLFGEKRRLEEENHKRNQEVLSLREQLKSLSDTIAQMNHAEGVMEETDGAKKEEREQKLDVDDVAIEFGSNEIAELKAQVVVLEKKLKEARDHSKSQSRTVLELKQRAQGSEMVATEELESYKGLFAEAEEEGNRLRKQVGHLRGENEHLTQQLTSIQHQLHLTQQESFRASQDIEIQKNERERLEASVAKMGILSANNCELQKKVKALENERDEAKSEAEAAQAQAFIYKNDFEEERKDREKAHSNMADFERKLAQKKGFLGEENAELKRQLGLHQQALEDTKQQLEKHKTSLSEVEYAYKKLQEEARTNNEYWLTEAAKLKEETKQHKSQAKELEKLRLEYQSKDSQLKRYKNECDILHKRLGQMERQEEGLQKKPKKTELHEEKGKKKKDKDKAKKTSDKGSAAPQTMSAEAAQRTLARTELLYNDAQDEISDYKETVDTLQEQLKLATAKISEMSNENSELKKQVAVLKELNKKLYDDQKSVTEPSTRDNEAQLRQTLEKQLHYSEMKQHPLQSPGADNERLAVGTGNISQPPPRASDPASSPLGNPPANTLGQAGYPQTSESVPPPQMSPQQYPPSQSQPIASQPHVSQMLPPQTAGYVRQPSGEPRARVDRRQLSAPLNQQGGDGVRLQPPHNVPGGASRFRSAPQGAVGSSDGGMYYDPQGSHVPNVPNAAYQQQPMVQEPGPGLRVHPQSGRQLQGQMVSDSRYGQNYQPQPSQQPQMDQLLERVQHQQQQENEQQYITNPQRMYYPTGMANQELQNPNQSQWGTPAYDQQRQQISRPSNVPVFQQQPNVNVIPSPSEYVATTPVTPDVQFAQECTQPTNGSLVGVPNPTPGSGMGHDTAGSGMGPGSGIGPNAYLDDTSRDGPPPLEYGDQPHPSQQQQRPIASGSDYPAITPPVPTPRRDIPPEPSTSTNPPTPPPSGMNLAESAGEEQFRNELQDNIDDEIGDVAAQVIEEGQSERHIVTSVQRPLDPNLICPMCTRQFRIGEIQKFRAHVKTCEGTKKDQEDGEGEGENEDGSTLI